MRPLCLDPYYMSDERLAGHMWVMHGRTGSLSDHAEDHRGGFDGSPPVSVAEAIAMGRRGERVTLGHDHQSGPPTEADRALYAKHGVSL